MSPQTDLDRTTLVARQPRGSQEADLSRSRARIIETAGRLYRKIGHKKTTVADIAHEMSMSPANVYRFFPSKQAIEEAVAGKLLEGIIAATVDAANRAGPVVGRLQAVLRTVERQNKLNADNDSRLYELAADAMRDNWAVARAYIDCLSSIVAQVISDGQAGGELRPGDSVALARCVLSATSAYLHPLAVPGGANCARPTLSQMIDFCIGALHAEGRWQHLAA
jgi:AcrR family transcriptional regulator